MTYQSNGLLTFFFFFGGGGGGWWVGWGGRWKIVALIATPA